MGCMLSSRGLDADGTWKLWRFDARMVSILASMAALHWGEEVSREC